MKWLTTEYIEQEAVTRKRALYCCLEHWRQLKTATPRELRIGINKRQVDIGPQHCSLCVRYNWHPNLRCDSTYSICRGCPLKCIRVWAKTRDTFYAWSHNANPKTWRAWQTAANKMYDKIDRTIKRLYPKEKQK